LSHFFCRRRDGGHRHAVRRDQDGTGELFDGGGHRRGKEERLALARQSREDSLYVVQKPHIEHAISFVEDEHFDLRKQYQPLRNEIQQSSRRRHQDVTATLEVLFLPALADAPKNHAGPKAGVTSAVLEIRGDLRGELSRRREHQRPDRAAGVTLDA
jgi:hypothetical protein